MTSEFLVSGIHTIPEYPPIALGMCMSFAKQEFAGDPRLEVSTRLAANEQELADLLQSGRVARRHILLFSNYLWNSKTNLRLSRLAKTLDPACVTIHGGPDTPAYTEASQNFLLREPHVDFIVAGEGEETLKELLEALVGAPRDLGAVNGLRFMSDGTFVETPKRARASDINNFPSPYLTGFFDDADPTQWQSATIETFRGCPYGCTFCDWGSVMGSKVKMFDVERVAAEIEWVAARKVNTIWIADSNFGISPRDIDIASKICEVKKRTGYPKALIATYAKNVKERVIDIVQMMADANLLSHGIISLQTSDADTLSVIRRSNIKTSEYEKLRQAFAERDLPLCAELMMALPGSTIAGFKGDLAYHFDLPIEVFVHRTVMLTNSPMAEPSYQLAHDIKVDEEGRVLSIATMSAADIATASTICRVFQGAHRYGILRYLMRWFQWEGGVQPLDLIHDLALDRPAHAEYPLLGALIADAATETRAISDLVDTLKPFRETLRSTSHWSDLSAQFIAWGLRRYGLVESAALRALGEVQAHTMPAADRIFPDCLVMRCDVVRWYGDWLDGRGEPLSAYGPGVLDIEDPLNLSGRSCSESSLTAPSYSWELESALFKTRRDSAKKLATPSLSAIQAEPRRVARSVSA